MRMKISRLLLLAAVGVAAGIFLTRTERGNQLRRNVSDRAGDWAKKLRRFRDQSVDYTEDFLSEAGKVTKSVRQKADGQLV